MQTLPQKKSISALLQNLRLCQAKTALCFQFFNSIHEVKTLTSHNKHEPITFKVQTSSFLLQQGKQTSPTELTSEGGTKKPVQIPTPPDSTDSFATW